jgi:hypothetical protein
MYAAAVPVGRPATPASREARRRDIDKLTRLFGG